jgi:hypothetical protein
MVLGSNWAFVIYKVFKSSNPIMFISCTSGHLDFPFVFIHSITSISVLQLTTQRPVRILLVYLEVKLQSQIFFICARWPSVLETKFQLLRKKNEFFFRSSLCKWIPLEWGVPPPTPTQLCLRWVLILVKPRSDWFVHNWQSTNCLPHAFRRNNVPHKKISVGQRQEDIRIISFEKGKGLKYSTSIAVEISNY